MLIGERERFLNHGEIYFIDDWRNDVRRIKPFHGQSLQDFFAVKRASIQRDIALLSHEYVLNASITELETFYTQSFRMEPLCVLVDDCSIIQQEQKLIRGEQAWPHRSSDIAVTVITIEVPYTGNQELWTLKPSHLQYSSRGFPEIVVDDQYLRFTLDIPEGSSTSSASMIRQDVASVLELLTRNTQNLNSNLRSSSTANIEHVTFLLKQRREQAQQALDLITALGIPLKKRDTPVGYHIPIERRASPITLPQVSDTHYEPEPELAGQEYDYILRILRSMALVMERSPQAFVTLDEEALRTHFLCQLNGHYEGTATGETFNASGKTDILIRVDNRTLFIAECKFWKGGHLFDQAIDQLLGYLSWRDVKCAILIFNRGQQSSAIRQKMHARMVARAEYRKTLASSSTGDPQYIFVKATDPGREIIITTQVYDIPMNSDRCVAPQE